MYTYWGVRAPESAGPHPASMFRSAYPGPQARFITPSELAFRNHMRLLWEQHVYWTRLAINSLAFTLPDIDVVLARLLRNAPDMGAALQPFYGPKIAEAYSKLITEHLTIAADLIKAAKKGDTVAAAEAENKWYANADQIIDFLNRINPYLPKGAFKKLFYSHLEMTKAEALAILNGQYKESVDIFERIEQGALMMADALSEAVVRQFPRMFRR
ncbi:acetylglutamate kinase [Paenibacillus tengchongensis]|uniref:acetylglutamate kinase n=1 Tax=Paenibacillus tengchongensis TaxID=2608684 RepID=UPI001FEBB871|nr:acetylglutamate kinase [Paenibacillus tengchongensis]